MTDIDNQLILQAVLRKDFASFVRKCFSTVSPGRDFVPNWHIQAMAHYAMKVIRGETRNLIIVMPPRNLKSITFSVALPAFILGHDPTARIVAISYSEELAAKHARDCRAIIESGWYRELFPGTRISRERNAGLDFETTRRGGRLSTSVGGTLTGRGGDYIIIDDPQKPADGMSAVRRASTIDWYRNTVTSRLDNKQEGKILLVMQRLHVEDLAGHLLEAGGWDHLSLPAIAIEDEEIPIGDGQFFRRRAGQPLNPKLEPLDVLERTRADMGTFHFSAQYQQAPVPKEGNLVKWDWFEFYDSPPGPDEKGIIVQSWDFAVKDGDANDYCVCITAHRFRNEIRILDVFRKKMIYPDQRNAVVDLARKHKAKIILIEAAANGSPLVSDLRRLKVHGVPTPTAITPRGSKVERFSVEAHRIEAGDIRSRKRRNGLMISGRSFLPFPMANMTIRSMHCHSCLHGPVDSSTPGLSIGLPFPESFAPIPIPQAISGSGEVSDIGRWIRH